MSASSMPNRITPVDQALFADTYGGSLVCCQVMLPLFGLSIIQGYLYLLNYGNDPRLLKAFVALIWSLGALNAVLVCHSVYHYLVLSYTNPLLLIQGEWSVYASTAVSILTCFLIDLFFARMLFRMTKGKWRIFILTVYGVLLPTQIAFGILFIYKLFALWDIPKLHAIVYPVMVPVFLSRVVTDAFTSTTLCIVLYDFRTDFGKTMRLIRTLIIYAINRFILTTLVLVAQVIFLLLKPKSIAAMVMGYVTVHLYINSFLATLNARASLRKGGVVDITGNYSFTATTHPGGTTGLDSTHNNSGVQLRIDSETFAITDMVTKSGEDTSLNTGKSYAV
ncbi:hypothetical protein DFH08DRAFT_902263 [Mycena albidolilacea]|uniref:DUF6534 domain-containing protein n=1 Tax=Mycena albidolilacea TaxID=1033008 RepID=A0AAD6Z384_9AGAR|nr:hypothetical protein DFH08DRAFT_902263 [Mycena albidolilacea]